MTRKTMFIKIKGRSFRENEWQSRDCESRKSSRNLRNSRKAQGWRELGEQRSKARARQGGDPGLELLPLPSWVHTILALMCVVQLYNCLRFPEEGWTVYSGSRVGLCLDGTLESLLKSLSQPCTS